MSDKAKIKTLVKAAPPSRPSLKDRYDDLSYVYVDDDRKDVADILTERKKDSSEECNQARKAPVLAGFVMLQGKPTRVSRGNSLPPPMDLVVRIRKTYRFTSNSASARSISIGDLLGAMGTICTTANTGVTSMCSAVRLVSITVWPSASSSTTFADVWFPSGGTGYEPEKHVNRNIPSGVTVTSAVSFRPPKNSLASFWTDSTLATSVIVFTSISVGSIIDVRLEGCLADQVAPVNISVATGTLGSVYYLAFDGPTTNSYPPVVLPSTH